MKYWTKEQNKQDKERN